ncbi:MAG TPA: VWA domain-containing protein [Candidatus Xenobia bacterium]|nr:VWA domain-containing protein [Candidatus Xenobia bacterium]
MSAFKSSRLFGTPALAAALCWSLLASGQEPTTSGGTLRVDVNVVNIFCTVKNKHGALVTDLAKTDFEVFEDGKKQEIKYFTRETDRPLTLALLVDTSGSQEAVLAVEKDSATQFLRQVLRPSDLSLLITFDLSVDLLQDFTSDADRLEEALRRARINAAGPPPGVQGPFPVKGTIGTRLYDAVYLASREKLGQEVGRKAIILISDGEDFGSNVKEEEALEAAQRSDTMIYAIGIADPQLYQMAFGRPYRGDEVLKKLARETGGRAIFPRKISDLPAAFDQIAAELRSQYSLGYTPTNSARDGRYRKLEVKLKRNGLRVQARRGYYAPGS